MRDNWAVGFSQRYTVGVWVGNASGAPAAPAGVVQSRTQFGDQLEAARSEWFIQGTEQPLFAINSVAINSRNHWAAGTKHFTNSNTEAQSGTQMTPRITAPASGTIIALDPDIPPNRQRLTFSAEGQAVRWLMDGKEFARGPQTQWLPWPGKHVVQLVDARGTVHDEVKIEVRGAGVKAASK